MEVKLDCIMTHDATTPSAVEILEEHGINRVFDPDKIVAVPDHFVPNKDIASAELARKFRDWVKEKGIMNYYEVGRNGICHAILPEQGHVLPGETIIGGDSHTCTYGALGAFSTGVGSTDLAAAIAMGKLWFRVPETLLFVLDGDLPEGVYSKDVILYIIGNIGTSGALYKTMEFSGEVIINLSVEGRLTITNMAIEAGAKSGIINPDEKTVEYVRERTKKSFKPVKSDEDAEYKDVLEYDLSDLEPQVAVPYSPGNVKPVSEVKGRKIDQVFIGGCTNGRIEDLRIAAKVLEGSDCEVNRLIVIPATSLVWKRAMDEGLFEIFYEAGAVISPPTCGPCLGAHMGVLGRDEVCVSTTNRNFVGRMGHKSSKVYLVSPATAAASAIRGEISDPREII